MSSMADQPAAMDPQQLQNASPAVSQSAINAYDRMLQEKERVIRESIAAKYHKIQAVERQLESLRVALHVNVGPRRQALEMLRSKIEAQNHKIDVHRQEYRKHKQLAEEAHAAMLREEALKNQMAEELNTLVQQSAGAQLKKLEELSTELEHLTAGLPAELAGNGSGPAAGGNQPAAAPVAAAHISSNTDATVTVQAGNGSHVAAESAAGETASDAAVQGPVPGQAGSAEASPAGTATERQREREEEAERRRRQLEEQRRAAVDARSRHVQLGGKRQVSSSRSAQPYSPATGAKSSMPAGSSRSGSPGPFRGFD